MSDFLPFVTSFVFMGLAGDAFLRRRVFNLSRSEDPMAYWVFVIGFVVMGLATALVAAMAGRG